MDWTAIGLTLRIAVLATSLLAIFGLPIAYALSRSQWRFKPAVESLLALPLVLPPTVLGFYLLVALGPRSPLGHAYEQAFGHTLTFSFPGIVIASVFYSLPFAIGPFASSFALIDAKLIEAAELAGSSYWRIFATIVVPLSVPGIVTGLLLSFAHTLGEFGVVLMVGGNIPGVTRTISISIYDDVQALEYARAAKTAALLLVVAFTILCTTYGLQARAGRRVRI